MKSSVKERSIPRGNRYPAPLRLLVASIFLALTGCVTSPLRTELDRYRVAEAMGYHPGEIALMHLCFFEEVEKPDSEGRLKGIRGVVAKTDSEICLMDGAIGLAPRRHFIKIPISEIEGVSGFPGQVQIRHQGRLFALVVYDWEDFRPNEALTNHIYNSLAGSNVPQFESAGHYSWSMLSPQRVRYYNSDSQQDNPPTNYEASIGAIMSQERARDREIEALFTK